MFSQYSDVLIWLSALGLAALLALLFRRHKAPALFGLGALALVLYGAHAADLVGWPGREFVSKGDEPGWGLVAALYVAMVLGMLAQYAFDRFSRPRGRRRKFAWETFIAPVFASPIVFLPLAASYLNMTPSGNVPWLMPLLVAFQNGFFWKYIVDTQQEVFKKRFGEAQKELKKPEED